MSRKESPVNISVKYILNTRKIHDPLTRTFLPPPPSLHILPALHGSSNESDCSPTFTNAFCLIRSFQNRIAPTKQRQQNANDTLKQTASNLYSLPPPYSVSVPPSPLFSAPAKTLVIKITKSRKNLRSQKLAASKFAQLNRGTKENSLRVEKVTVGKGKKERKRGARG